MSTGVQTATTLLSSTRLAAQRATDAMLAMQYDDGYWWAELTADTTLESDWLLLQLWLHPPKDGVWDPPNRPLIEKAVASILERQLPDGGFYVYPQGPSDVSATVKAYFALKLAGLEYDHPRLAQARERILALGGNPGREQLCQGEPEPVRSLPARTLPIDSPGDHAAAGKFHLSDVVLDPGHRYSTFDRAFV